MNKVEFIDSLENYKVDLFENYKVVLGGEMYKGETRRLVFSLSQAAKDAGFKLTELIEDIDKPCTCTASIVWDDEKLTAMLTYEDKDKKGDKRTYIKVLLDDGVRKESNGRGRMVFPQDKRMLKLYINAKFV